MLYSLKRELHTDLARDILRVRELELNYFTSNIYNIGLQSAFLAGFLFTILATHNSEPLHKELYQNARSQGAAFVVIDRAYLVEEADARQVSAIILELIYLISNISGLGSTLFTVYVSLVSGILGPGLALRGPEGSMDRAVIGMARVNRDVVGTFRNTLTLFQVSIAVNGFLNFHLIAAIICIIFMLYFLRRMRDHQNRLLKEFNVAREQIVTGRFESDLAQQQRGAPVAGDVVAPDSTCASEGLRRSGVGGGSVSTGYDLTTTAATAASGAGCDDSLGSAAGSGSGSEAVAGPGGGHGSSRGSSSLAAAVVQPAVQLQRRSKMAVLDNAADVEATQHPHGSPAGDDVTKDHRPSAVARRMAFFWQGGSHLHAAHTSQLGRDGLPRSAARATPFGAEDGGSWFPFFTGQDAADTLLMPMTEEELREAAQADARVSWEEDEAVEAEARAMLDRNQGAGVASGGVGAAGPSAQTRPDAGSEVRAPWMGRRKQSSRATANASEAHPAAPAGAQAAAPRLGGTAPSAEQQPPQSAASRSAAAPPPASMKREVTPFVSYIGKLLNI
mmetsp:Transcript_15396/g.46914  ORF Transcript_15396/g.46914 Transcript_15396/m.46914 type:complete len:561 (-) Transcript_15396:295-1977(-)